VFSHARKQRRKRKREQELKEKLIAEGKADAEEGGGEEGAPKEELRAGDPRLK